MVWTANCIYPITWGSRSLINTFVFIRGQTDRFVGHRNYFPTTGQKCPRLYFIMTTILQARAVFWFHCTPWASDHLVVDPCDISVGSWPFAYTKTFNQTKRTQVTLLLLIVRASTVHFLLFVNLFSLLCQVHSCAILLRTYFTVYAKAAKPTMTNRFARAPPSSPWLRLTCCRSGRLAGPGWACPLTGGCPFWPWWASPSGTTSGRGNACEWDLNSSWSRCFCLISCIDKRILKAPLRVLLTRTAWTQIKWRSYFEIKIL